MRPALRNHRRPGIAACVALLAALGLATATSAQIMTPLATGTAGADLALGFGLDAINGNPAQLALGTAPVTQLRVVNLGGSLSNNGFGFSEYRRYNGTILSDDDKSDILGNIPADGLQVQAEGGISALAFRTGRWALTTSADLSAQGQLDREAFALLLFGNAHQSDWVFDQSSASGLAFWKVALSHGRPIATVRGRPLTVGFSLSYLRGLYYAESQDAQAVLATQDGGLAGNAHADWLTAAGGSGWGMDVGAAWQPTDHALVSLKLENLVHTINWNRDVTLRHFALTFDDLTIGNFDDSLWISEETSEARPSVRTGLPVRLRLGVAREFSRLRVAGEVSASFANRFAASTTPRVASGLEYTPWRPLLVRFGVAAGGPNGFSVGWGLGLRVGPMTLNTAARVDRGLWIGSGRGITGAVALDINF